MCVHVGIVAQGKKRKSERREILTSETQMTATIDRSLRRTNEIHSKQTKIEWSGKKARGSKDIGSAAQDECATRSKCGVVHCVAHGTHTLGLIYLAKLVGSACRNWHNASNSLTKTFALFLSLFHSFRFFRMYSFIPPPLCSWCHCHRRHRCACCFLISFYYPLFRRLL